MSLGNQLVSKLSKRELQVAHLMVEGKTTSFIAMNLGIKSNTVSTIKKRVYTKLNVASVIDLYKLIAQ
jgi:DNA-binding CsgD family transcriptional regulator